MKVEIIERKSTVKFSEILQGELFLFKGNMYLRTEACEDIDQMDCNAVNVVDGDLYYFYNTSEVEKVEGKLTINRL